MMTELSAHCRLEDEEAAQHRLLAVEIDPVGAGQQFGGLFPFRYPVIKAGRLPRTVGARQRLPGWAPERCPAAFSLAVTQRKRLTPHGNRACSPRSAGTTG